MSESDALTAHQLARKLLDGPDVRVVISTSCHGCSGTARYTEVVSDKQHGERVLIDDYVPEPPMSESELLSYLNDPDDDDD